MFSIFLNSSEEADIIRRKLNSDGVQAVIHYVPLHDSPVGESLGYSAGDLPSTIEMASRLIRLPLHSQMSVEDCRVVVKKTIDAIS